MGLGGGAQSPNTNVIWKLDTSLLYKLHWLLLSHMVTWAARAAGENCLYLGSRVCQKKLCEVLLLRGRNGEWIPGVEVSR